MKKKTNNFQMMNTSGFKFLSCLQKTFLAISILLIAVSCGNNNNNDSVDNAMDANQAKIQDSTAAINNADADFMVKAANGGMAEVEQGKLAETKATAGSVKDFASMMVKDHDKINNRLKALADSMSVTLPAAIDKDQQDNMDDLNKKSVKDFDKAYMKLMVSEHNSDVDLFEKASKDVTSAGLHNFILETLPILQAHQKAAKDLNSSIK